MKRNYFCHRDNYWDLTKDEIKVMMRGNRNFTPRQFAEYYNILPELYREFIMAKGLKFTVLERRYVYELRNEIEKRKNADVNLNRLELPLNWLNVDEIPKGLICAMYNVDFDVKDNKRYFDVLQLQEAKEDLQNKIHRYYNRVSTKEEEFSKLKHYDLIAMRLFRGYTKKEIAKLTDLPYDSIVMYETKGSAIPKVVANAYANTLKIKKRHLVQLREIMSGKAANIVDDRAIPKFIKLKVWSRDKGKCTDCSKDEKLHYHHIKHFAEGGRHTEDNIKLLCATCHAKAHKGEKAYYMLKKMAEE
ncbi:HNH endonuclease [Peribacillus muralis]|uniref:HNH endonuclease n=1 Tax=Peribacillus muralis TaxID=264697 RepID=UPI003CFD8290